MQKNIKQFLRALEKSEERPPSWLDHCERVKQNYPWAGDSQSHMTFAHLMFAYAVEATPNSLLSGSDLGRFADLVNKASRKLNELAVRGRRVGGGHSLSQAFGSVVTPAPHWDKPPWPEPEPEEEEEEEEERNR